VRTPLRTLSLRFYVKHVLDAVRLSQIINPTTRARAESSGAAK